MKRFLQRCLLFFLGATSLFAQLSVIGGKEYGLAASSVMWIPRGSALYLNPAEIGRIHQDEFLLNTNRFRSMSSMTGTFSIPFVGSFAGGVANQGPLTHYTFGYGRLLGRYHTIGGSIAVITPIEDGVRYSFGSAMHIPSSVQNSGIHAGVSIANLPNEAMINGGVAWWAVPDWFRMQVAAQNRIHRAIVYGGEFYISNDFSVLLGSRAMKTMHGGISYQTSSFTADLAAGPSGLSFSLNIILGETAWEKRGIAYEEGYNLFSEKRYNDALQKFLIALEYDEYDDDSYSMASNASSTMDTVEAFNLEKAISFRERHDYPSAIDAYLAALAANPSNVQAESLLSNTRNEFRAYVGLLIVSGDSLKSRKEIVKARKNYELALQFDPGNEIASARIDELDNLSKENVKSVLGRAQTLLNKKQFENAQKEFERILALEPKNAQAKAGLNKIKQQKKDEQYEAAKTALVEGRYFDALKMFLDLSGQNITYKDLPSYIDIARSKLQPQVERQFKSGLAHYANENYHEAIRIWDDALLIQPRHPGILEYRKRAEEKMKALEQLK